MINIYYINLDNTTKYAADELSRIISSIYCRDVVLKEMVDLEQADFEKVTPKENIAIYLGIDKQLCMDEVAVTSNHSLAQINGGSSAALLNGVYWFVEQLGCVFEFSGEVLPQKSDSTILPDLELKHVPSIKQRGIRMHLNFVQDQSFFTKAEFESFIDNIARQKMNYLMFHMYTSQAWYPFTYRGTKHLELELGNLGRKSIDPGMIGRDKVKVKDHWYPADLEHITDPEELLAAVYERYKDLMKRCHERGITTAVSIEPESLPELFETKLEEWSGEGLESLIAGRDLSNNWQEDWSGRKLVEPDITHPLMLDIAVERCLQCIDAFPDLDELQLISREGTSWNPKEGESFEKEIDRLIKKFSLPVEYFDAELLGQKAQVNEGPEMNAKAHPYWTVLPGSDYYATVIGSLRFAEYAVNILQDERLRQKIKDRKIDVSIAIYSPNPTTIKLMMPAIAKILPAGTRFHCLADYGAKDIADNLEAWKPVCNGDLTPGLISWLEFDGNMMLAQCWMSALSENIKKAYDMGIRTMHFNHWRVRSLEHNAAIAASSCWNVNANASNEYLSAVYGKDCSLLAEEAYDALENATTYAKKRNYNIGFTNDWVYQHSTDVPGYYWKYLLVSAANFKSAADRFTQVSSSCQKAYGKRQAAYLADLCSISSIHIEAVQHLQNAKLPLVGYKAWPLGNEHVAWPRPEELEIYAEEAKKAFELEQHYMRTYSAWVSSCDEQGQLVMQHQGVVEPFERFAELLKQKLNEQKDIQNIFINSRRA